MKKLGILLIICMGWTNTLWAKESLFLPRYAKQIRVQLFSDRNGTAEEGDFQPDPRGYCFSESFTCFMTRGKCVCPLHKCEAWPDEASKAHWLLISGTDAEHVCGRAAVYALTNIFPCNLSRNPHCDGGNIPRNEPRMHANEWVPQNYKSGIPPDSRHK
jgi:hypothetical protein